MTKAQIHFDEHLRRINLTNPSDILDVLTTCISTKQFNGLWAAISNYYTAKGCKIQCTGPTLDQIFLYAKYSQGVLTVSSSHTTAVFKPYGSSDWEEVVTLGNDNDLRIATLIALFQHEARFADHCNLSQTTPK